MIALFIILFSPLVLLVYYGKWGPASCCNNTLPGCLWWFVSHSMSSTVNKIRQLESTYDSWDASYVGWHAFCIWAYSALNFPSMFLILMAFNSSSDCPSHLSDNFTMLVFNSSSGIFFIFLSFSLWCPYFLVINHPFRVSTFFALTGAFSSLDPGEDNLIVWPKSWESSSDNYGTFTWHLESMDQQIGFERRSMKPWQKFCLSTSWSKHSHCDQCCKEYCNLSDT